MLQPRIDEIGREIGQQRLLVAFDDGVGDVVLAQQVHIGRVAEALVPRLEHVAQRHAVLLPRQMAEEGGERFAIEGAGRRELPQDRPELRPQLGDAGHQERRHQFARGGQVLLVRGEPRRLHGEDEPVRHRVAPFGEALGLLPAVERAVDLDRRHALAGISQLLRMRQAVGVERAAPGRKGPAADADVNAVP